MLSIYETYCDLCEFTIGKRNVLLDGSVILLKREQTFARWRSCHGNCLFADYQKQFTFSVWW